MTDKYEEHAGQNLELTEQPIVAERRSFLRSLGKWSQVVIGGAVLGSAMTAPATASSWINRGQGSWVNSPNSWNNRGGSWVNRSGGWINNPRGWNNRGGSWANRSGGGGWVNRSGGGGGWHNRSGGWINR